ncbi:MAG: TIGR02680 family protein [Cellulomonas sp.]
MNQDSAAPRPTTRRWQPLRLGLVDLFYYDDEQFWFHDGRLLLRGNNGTGKSKVLALTLPFLLDGSLAAQRVEPDADPKKRMEWNLLLGGDHPNSERLGYTWVEFGRVDDEGIEHFTTLGCGLKAVAGRGISRHWFFITDRRIGDLRLVDANGIALARERLRDELEDRGRVYDTREEYRHAVDEALFGLGPSRYSALVDLLIQLRQPQLSKRPDARALSGALTEALAPLDQAVIADVAESFRSLEEDRSRLLEAESTHDAAAAFLRHYAEYARVASRRAAKGVRTTQSEYEHLGREQGVADEKLALARAELDRVTGAETQLTLDRSGLLGTQDALRTSPEMDAARELEEAGNAAALSQAAAALALGDVQQAEKRRGATAAEVETATRAERDAREHFARLNSEAADRFVAAGLGATHGALLTDDGAAREALSRRRDQLDHVGRLVTTADQAHGHAEQQRQAFDDAQAREAQRSEQAAASDRVLEDAVTGYAVRLGDYVRSLTILVVEDDDDVLDLSARWAVAQDGPAPARRAIERAAAEATSQIAASRARSENEKSELSAELAEVRARLAELDQGETPQPAGLPTRDTRVRASAPGAPLWRLTDFAENLDATDRAGLESALEAAGLLDAWVRPDGSVTRVATGDLVLGAAPDGGETTPLPAQDSLAAALKPSVAPVGAGPDATPAVGDAVVQGVLARIGWGKDSGAPVWVDRAGNFALGPARGAWSKSHAQFIGASAREANRRAAIELQQARARELEALLEALLGELAALEVRRHAAEVEQSKYPQESETLLVRAHAAVEAAVREVESARADARESDQAWQAGLRAATHCRELAAEAAADVGSAHTAAGLRTNRDDLDEYAAALRLAREGRDAAARAGRDLSAAVVRARDAAADHTDRQGRHLAAGRENTLATARHATLLGAVGKAVAELQEDLARIRTALNDLDGLATRLVRERDSASRLLGIAEERIAGLARERDAATGRRADAITVLRRFASTQLLHIALPGIDTPGAEPAWTARAATTLAREVEAALVDVAMDTDAWDRVQQRTSNAFTELSAQMSRQGHTAISEQHEEGMTVRVAFQSQELAIDALVDTLARDIEIRQQILSAREREILENHLVTDVAGHLSDLLGQAQGQVDDLNRELSGRKTSTGMQLRVLWRSRPDGPSGFAVARGLLLRSADVWNTADRAAIGDFLQAQISAARLADPTAGWAEQLQIALDYRTWHDFAVERQQNGQWRPATGPASGGERVLTVSIPLFAAASSHYHSASNPYAPRLILLDEAFAGVDDDSRAKSLGLLATFDLDVVMTSEREWGCYPQVPGLAIAQLSRVEGVDAVGVTRWRWDGSNRTLDASPGQTAAAGEARMSEVDAGSLFD